MNVIIPRVKAFVIGDDRLDIDTLLKHRYDDVSEASEKLPGSMGWMSYQIGRFRECHYMAKVNLKVREGQLYHHYRANGLEADGLSGKLTETAIEHAINIHPDILELHAEIAKYDRFVATLENYMRSFEKKIELVRTGEATHRKVADQEPMSDEELTNRTAQNAKTTGDKNE